MSRPGAVPERRLWAANALLPQGWAREVLLQWDAGGAFTQVESGVQAPAGVERAAGRCCLACPTCIRMPSSAPSPA